MHASTSPHDDKCGTAETIEEPPVAVSVTTKHSEYVNLPPVKFIISDFTKKKECNAEWMSPPFYTHPQGYKCCLVAYPNGYESTNTHLSVGVLLLKGDAVNIICPLEIGFMIDLLNWREDKQNCQAVLEFNSANNLVTKKGTRRSPIYKNFVPHSSLSYDSTTNTEYLQNDCCATESEQGDTLLYCSPQQDTIPGRIPTIATSHYTSSL